jgi:hypothetical protein
MINTLILASLMLSQTPAQTTPPEPATVEVPALSEADALKVENWNLRVALLNAQIDARTRSLNEERAAIIQRVRDNYPGMDLDMESGTLIPMAPSDPKPTP